MSESQDALRVLSSSELLFKILNANASWNCITLIWVPGHCGIQGDKKPNELARRGSIPIFIDLELVLSIPKSTAIGYIKNCIKDEHWFT